MPRHAWRRQHGPLVISQVEPTELGLWRASAWRTTHPDLIVEAPKPFPAFLSAQVRADTLARAEFDHVCDMPGCSDWFPTLID